MLGLAQPTISGQLALFEKTIGVKVFRRESRKLVLTENGWLIFNYADEIFSIGDELNSWLRGKSSERRRTLKIGICNSIDMTIVRMLLAPILDSQESPQLICFNGDAERLLLELRLRSYDLTILPAQDAPSEGNGAFRHLLANLEVSLFAPSESANKLRKSFPQSAHRAPIVLPAPDGGLRQSLDCWFQEHGIEPDIKAEIGVSELAKSVAASCGGLVLAPTVAGNEMRQRYGFEAIGALQGVEERVYAVTNQRKIRNPAAARIVGIESQ